MGTDELPRSFSVLREKTGPRASRSRRWRWKLSVSFYSAPGGPSRRSPLAEPLDEVEKSFVVNGSCPGCRTARSDRRPLDEVEATHDAGGWPFRRRATIRWLDEALPTVRKVPNYRTVLFAPAEFACDFNGAKYNCLAK
jgi:hypothetical protein